MLKSSVRVTAFILSVLILISHLLAELEESLVEERAARKAAEQEQDALQSLLNSERQQRLQAEEAMDCIRGISPAAVPVFVEALDKLAQLTDRVMLANGS